MRCCKIKCDKKNKNAWKKMNTIKNTKKRNKNEWMQKKGGAAVLWGVQKIKGRRRMGRACGSWFWTGLGLKRVGSGEEYIRVETHFFLIFFFSFSLFSLLRAKRSLLSPPSPLSFPASGGSSETAPTRRLAVVDGGAAAQTLFFYFFSCLHIYSLFSIHFWA